MLEVIKSLFQSLFVTKNSCGHGKACMNDAVPVVIKVTLVNIAFAGYHALLAQSLSNFSRLFWRKEVTCHVKTNSCCPSKVSRF